MRIRMLQSSPVPGNARPTKAHDVPVQRAGRDSRRDYIRGLQPTGQTIGMVPLRTEIAGPGVGHQRRDSALWRTPEPG